MAGVNLSEESARILATNSELVGTLTRSCKDETFLLPAPLQRRILEIGMALGVRPPPVGLVWTTAAVLTTELSWAWGDTPCPLSPVLPGLCFPWGWR